MRAAKFQTVAAAFAALALVLFFYCLAPKAQADDQRKMTTCAALGEELRAAKAAMPANARESISLLIMEERRKPDEFSDSWRWRLDNCGKWCVNAEQLFWIAYYAIPINGTDIAEDDPIVQRVRVLAERIKDYGGLVAVVLPQLFEIPTEDAWTKWTSAVWDAPREEVPPKDISALWLPKREGENKKK